MRLTALLLAAFFLQPPATEIRLIVKGDDMGAAHGINVGTIAAYKGGVLTTTNVIVPGPWFLDADQQRTTTVQVNLSDVPSGSTCQVTIMKGSSAVKGSTSTYAVG